jgi:histone acetyltransferase (RNA polymerase elongator complex component)
MKRNYIIPIFVPHKGCPNDCIFCNQKKIASTIVEISDLDVKNTIESYLCTIPNDAHIEVAFYGGSFTGIKIEYQNELLRVAKSYLDNKKIRGIRLSTRPDYINTEILDNLYNMGVTEIELGVQSMCDDVLLASNRGHLAKDVSKAVELIRKYPFKLGLQMMTGMYKSNFEKDLYTAKEIINLKPDFVRIYPTLIIADTHLEDLYKRNEYIPMKLEECIVLCAELLIRFEKEDIKVIRLGLQPTDVINLDGAVVAGPFHSAIRELVESKIMLKMFLDSYKDVSNNNIECNELEIIINPRSISRFVGNNKQNIENIKKICNKKIKLVQDENILENDFQINLANSSIYMSRRNWIGRSL